MNPPGDAMVAAALDLAIRGWRGVPLHTPTLERCSCSAGRDCKHPGKHPRIKGWQQRATNDQPQIEEWWREWPDANLGVACGVRSGVVVLDINPRNGGDDRLVELERQHGRLPRTVSDVSGGGQHFMFRVQTVVRAIDLGGGVELLGEDKLVVVPPSLHVSGRRYEWDEHPDETPLTDVPAWLYATARPARPRVASQGVISKGKRNATLTRIAGRLRLVMSYAEGVLPALFAINAECCRPPLPDTEVEAIARSATSWSGLPWLTAPREFFTDPRLSTTARSVLRVMCDCAKADGEVCVSYAQIEHLTGIKSDATVSRALRALESSEHISFKKTIRFEGSRFDSKVYAISRALPA